ncbi:MAG: HAD family phosphatase [Firmicutes bacterium]|nr:HAD family phosphatase [Bacillota bacterium]
MVEEREKSGRAVKSLKIGGKEGKMMLEAVLFDMDGVLIDSEPWHLEANRELCAELGFKLRMEEYANFIGKSSSEKWTYFKTKYDLGPTVPELVERENRKNIQMIPDNGEGLIKGVLPLLQTLQERGVGCGVASSSPLAYIEAVLEKYKLYPFFQAVVSGENMAKGKPAPDIFLHTAKLLGAHPEHCVVIEDSEHGVQAAKAGRMKCIGFKNKNSGEQDLSPADLIVDSLEAISFHSLESLLYC